MYVYINCVEYVYKNVHGYKYTVAYENHLRYQVNNYTYM